ncbi:MAG TPA: RDD family protein, partial [Micromonosporaceae bacterium]
ALWSALTGSAPGWLTVCSQFGAALLPLFYFTVSWWGTGQTAGDLLFGVVVRVAPDRHVGLCRAFLRALVGLMLPLIWLVGLVGILLDSRRRALHDRLFSTVVVHKAVPPTRT